MKILKLHGDLFYRKFYYTEDELEEFPAEINESLHRFLNHHDLLIVGHSMSDRDINRCLKADGGTIWYVNRSAPQASLASVMKARQSRGNEIVGELGAFDAFFVRLRELLLRDAAGVNVDEIAQSIFSLFAPGRLPVGCGFLLADTGLVVTDSTILGDLKVGQEPGAAIRLRPFAGGPELDAELVIPPKSVLDFAVFKLSQPAARSPLELSLALPALGDPATACISHGSTQGFHDARVTGVEVTLPIQDAKGRSHDISHLIELNMRVAEGSCGSPVVSKDGRVIGVVVAGNGSSYALSVLALQRKLEAAGLVPKSGVPRRAEPKTSRSRGKTRARRATR